MYVMGKSLLTGVYLGGLHEKVHTKLCVCVFI